MVKYKLTDAERATALKNEITWAVEYVYRVAESLDLNRPEMAKRDLDGLMDIVDSIKHLTEAKEVVINE
tara:strand:- start:558 stop:764 length:207 start_codon:yes stop_codon:yes gene_type:complete